MIMVLNRLLNFTLSKKTNGQNILDNWSKNGELCRPTFYTQNEKASYCDASKVRFSYCPMIGNSFEKSKTVGNFFLKANIEY